MMKLCQVLIFSSLFYQIYTIPSAKAWELLTVSEIVDFNLAHNLSRGWPDFDPDKGTSGMYRQSWEYYLETVRRRIPRNWKTEFKLSKQEGLFAGMPEKYNPFFESKIKDSISEFSFQIHKNVKSLEKELNHEIFADEEWENEKREAQMNLRSSVESLRIFIEKLKVLSPDLSELATRLALTEGIDPFWQDTKPLASGEKGKTVSVIDLLDQIPDEGLKRELLGTLPNPKSPATGPKALGRDENPPVLSQVKIDNSSPDTNPLCGLSKSSAAREAIGNFERGRASKSQILINGDASEPSGFNCRMVKFGLVRDPKDKSIGLDPESYVVFPDGRQIKLNNDDLKALREAWRMRFNQGTGLLLNRQQSGGLRAHNSARHARDGNSNLNGLFCCGQK